MSRQGLLIDVEYCTGCQSCNIACKQEHNHEAGTFGILVTEHIYPGVNEKVQIDFVPFVTTLCDLCAHRRASGEDSQPTCVRHCQSQCMEFGSEEELIEKSKAMRRPVIFLK